jgi:alanine racemase
MELFRRTFADINLENLQHNWDLIKKTAADDRYICPMVKANAYGHGLSHVGLVLERSGAKSLGVCLIEEGLELRSAGVKTEILVFRGFDKRGAEKILEYQMTPVVSAWNQIQALEAVADEPVKVHLKFNTGMNRLGFDPAESEKLLAHFQKSKKLKLKAVLTHLSESSDSLNLNGTSAKQIKLFQSIKSHFDSLHVFDHVLNSGAIEAIAEAQLLKVDSAVTSYAWGMRPGLMLYGYSSNKNFKALDLKPVMSFKSVINNIRRISKGEGVSYGSTWKAPRDSQVAVVPAGYADGVHRVLSNKAHVLVCGERVPVVGQICMDFFIIDMTDLCQKFNRQDWEEEEVTIFGPDDTGHLISADEVSQLSSTISWETLTSVSERVPRHFKGLKTS